MRDKMYPIGTEIIFIAHSGMCSLAIRDDGKRGKVVGETSCGEARIFLPTSVKGWSNEFTWITSWDNIKPIITKNQQLLFDFAYKES